MTPTGKTFGDWLKAERERKNIIPAEFARRAGVKPQYIHNLENNIPNKNGNLTRPSSEVCLRFARVLGVHYFDALRAAGHLPEELPESAINATMAADYVYALPAEQQEEALRYLKYIYEEFGNESKMRERAPKHPSVVDPKEESPPPIASTTPLQLCESASDSEGQAHEKPPAKTHKEPPAKKTGQNGGRLPAEKFGRDYMIKEEDLKLVDHHDERDG